MKIALVLFGLFAASMASSPDARSVVSDLAQSVIGKATAELSTIESGLKNLVTDTKSKADGYLSNARNQVGVVIASLQANFDNLIGRGGQIKTCALNQLSQFTTIKNDIGKNIGGCDTGIATSLSAVQADVSNLMVQLKATLSSLFDMVKGCINQVLDAVTCAISHINPAKEAVDNVIADAQAALTNAETRVKQSLANIQTCAINTAATAITQLNVLGQNLKKCV